jgi:N-acetylmuramoyl-L-alanine amidase
VIIRNLSIRRMAMSMTGKSFAAVKQQELARKRRKAIFGIKFANVAVYAGVFLLLVSIIYLGYDQPEVESKVRNVVTDRAVNVEEMPSVDDVIAVNVAAGLAQVANLPVAASVSNLALSVETIATIMGSDTLAVIKPQIIESVVESRLVQNYTVLAGDTVPIVASKFNVSAQTIKWANNLTSDVLTADSVIKILPVDGILYTVKSTDTIESIVTKYKVDATRFITYNDLEVTGLVANTSIILPDGVLPEVERPGYVAPVVQVATPTTYNYYYASGTGFGGSTWFIGYGTGPCNTYAYGNCTCYAYSRRKALGLGVGAHWGNANTWATNAARDGYAVSQTPSVGAIMQSSSGWYGHVSIVESIAENGDLTISEMNAYVSGGGYNIVSGRTILAGNVGQYWFIR